MNQFVPIFEKDGNEFFILTEDFVAEDEWGASKLGLGSFVESVLWNATYTGRSINVCNGIPHLKAEVMGTPVAVIRGPLFDEVS